MAIFISYARKDKSLVEPFFEHLGTLAAGDKTFKPLSDQEIPSGAAWAKWIQQQIAEAEGGILLISSAFLESRWCTREAAALYERLEPERVLPVLVRSCDWEGVEWLSPYQFVNLEPAIDPKVDSDARWTEIVRKIRKARDAWPDKVGGTGGRGRDETGKEVGLHTLRAALYPEGGGVTFFLGPGVYEMQGDAPPAEHIRVRFDLLEEGLADGPSIEYAKAIVEENLPGALRHNTSIPKPQEEWREDLVAFQASVARLGSFASQLLVRKMYEDKTPLGTSKALIIPLEENEETRNLRTLAFDACHRIAVLWDRPFLRRESNRIGMGIQGLIEQIMALTYVAFVRDVANPTDDQSREWHQVFQRTLDSAAKEEIRTLRSDPPKQFLALSHLEWLADLLWHTLRFDTPVYPKPGDLAFQLSACTQQFTPPRRENVGTIASLALPALRGVATSIEEVKACINQVATWLETAAGVGQHKIYHALACALCDFWNRRKRLSGAFGRQIPLAVTTNFDNELEHILSGAHISHHVLFPVYYRRKSKLSGGSPQEDEQGDDWMLYTESWEQGEDYPAPSWLRLDGASLQSLDFEGPLVVKLYGSPLTRIKQNRVLFLGEENRAERFEFAHRLVVSDLDLLGVTVRQDWWPTGLQSLLFEQHNRLICFLGYSPTNVDNRLRLFEHVYRNETSVAGRVVVMNPPKDPIYSHYLKHMRVEALSEDLSKVCEVIETYCQCEPLEKLRSRE